MSESFFSKTAKFTPNLLKSSVGRLNQISSRHSNLNTTNNNSESFANTLKNVNSKNYINFKDNSPKKINSIHTVKSGETLSHIALESMRKAGFKLSGQAIMKMAYKIANHNSIENPNLIVPGQKLDLSVISSKDSQTLNRSEKLAFQANVNKDSAKQADLSLENLNNIKNFKKLDLAPKKILDPKVLATSNSNNLSNSSHHLLNKTLHRAADLGYISFKDADKAKEKISNMAHRFNFIPDDFARVALMESDGFNPKATNGSCHGIIQFCDGKGRGAASVGLSHDPEKILQLDILDQLDLVSQYFEDTDLRRFNPASLEELYLTILSPASRNISNMHQPLSIQGTQAKALHVGGSVNEPITKASIRNGLIGHAENTLSRHIFSNQDKKNRQPLALNSDNS